MRTCYDVYMANRKRQVSNETLLKAITVVSEQIGKLATKDEVARIKLHMATDKHIEALKDEFEYQGEHIDALQSGVELIKKRGATKEDLEELRIATKGDIAFAVEKAKDEILDRFEPMERAVDSNSVSIISHERRITHLETVKR